MSDRDHTTFVLTGPTASGKTQLGIDLAERLGAEIVSMDSMALYRGMDVGTAKPTLAERARVRHHLIDVLDPWESASVAWWRERATQCSRDIRDRGKRVLFVGGTPLYLKALLYGLFKGPAADPGLRARLSEESRTFGVSALHQRLHQVDPDAAAKIHFNDLRRIIRALEVWELTGRPMSSWQQQWSSNPTGRLEVVWLDRPREQLYQRIDERVQRMFRDGLVAEVERLRGLGKPLSRVPLQALGYKEVLSHLGGAAPLDETIRQVQQRSRNFAKRQISWFRHLAPCQPVSPELTSTLWRSTIDSDQKQDRTGS
jgi:tRNA dimethylallyltransferase